MMLGVLSRRLPAMSRSSGSALGLAGARRLARATLSVRNDQGVTYSDVRSDAEWRKSLTAEQYNILRRKGTEYPGTGGYNDFAPAQGHFCCAGCGQPLYSAASKFASGCGWPAFDKIVTGAVVTETDRSLGMSRVEILCSGCGGHLGHVFEGALTRSRVRLLVVAFPVLLPGEGFTETSERHCVNSASITYSTEPLPSNASESKVLM